MLWDPLSTFNDESQEELIAIARKREIYNILKSYVGFFDPFCEIIQNAMDAVDDRKKILNESDYIKKIWISINIKEGIISVTDNGIGFTEEKFRVFLCPNVSFKDGKSSRGHKGVGATYIGYGFNYLQIGTKSPNYKAVVEIKNGRNWIEDSEGKVKKPLVGNSNLIHEVFNSIERGSTFSIKLIGNNVRPKDLTWIGATNASQWRDILLIKTPLGHVDTDINSNDQIIFDIEVIDKEGNISYLENQIASYIYPHLVIPTSVDIKVISEEQKKLANKNIDASKINDKYKHLNGVYISYNHNEVIQALGLKEDTVEYNLVTEYSIHVYGYFCYSTSLWDTYNDSKLGLRKGARILRGGLQLATNNMPQGELIMIPLTSNIGYQNQSHVVVHFNNADPDLGRKGFQPELQDVAKSIGVGVVNLLKKWRGNLKVDDGFVQGILDQTKLDEWIDEQKIHEKQKPLLLLSDHFFIPVNEVSVTAEPLSEQDVIVLFSQLLAGGVIRSIKLMSTSQHQKYDGVFRYFVKPPVENHVFDKEKNPLGVPEINFQGDEPIKSSPFILEYKYCVDALIREFENDEKLEKDIDLVVAWTIGDEYKKRYMVTSLLDLENLHHRQFHGITHLFRDEKTGEIRFRAIILSELIEYLNNIDLSQENQKMKYGQVE